MAVNTRARDIGAALIAGGGGVRVGAPQGGIHGGGGLEKSLQAIERSSTNKSRAATKKKNQKKSGWRSFMGALKPFFDVIDTPRAAITAGVSELQDIRAGEDTGSWVEKTFDVEKRVQGSELLERASNLPDWIDENKIVRGISGFGLDVGLDPLTYVTAGVGGLAKKGAQKGAEEIVQSTGRQLAKAATKEAAKETGDIVAARSVGELIEQYGEAEALKQIRSKGATAASKYRRGGVSALEREEIAQFLTREGTQKPLADRGLGFMGKKIPGSDIEPLNAVNRTIHKGLAKAGDVWQSKGGAFEGNLSLKQAARSGDPERAYKAIETQLKRGTALSQMSSIEKQAYKKYLRATKGMSADDKARLLPALEGSAEDIAFLGGREEGVRGVLNELFSGGQAAGLNIRKLSDYAPRQLTPEARAAMEKIGIMTRGGGLNRETFESARKLLPNQENTFLGETFRAETNAGVTENVQRIARQKLEPIMSKDELDDVLTFFSADPDKVMKRYIQGMARRTAMADAATRLYDVGIGTQTRKLAQKLSEEGVAEKAGTERLLNLSDKRIAQLEGRAGQQDEAVLGMQQHLMSQRAGQLEADVAGHPLSQPFADETTVAFAQMARAGAEGDLDAISQRLALLEREDVMRATRRGRRAAELDSEVAALRDQLDELQASGITSDQQRGEAAWLNEQIAKLEPKRLHYKARRDKLLDEALSGERTGVVMPQGYEEIATPNTWNQMGDVWVEQATEVLPVGGWRGITEQQAWRDGVASHAALQELKTTGVKVHKAKVAFAEAYANDSIEHAMTAYGQLIRAVRGDISPQELTDEINELFPSMSEYPLGGQGRGGLQSTATAPHIKGTFTDAKAIRKKFDDVERSLNEQANDIAQRLKKGSKYAERNPDTGMVLGPLYHGTNTRMLNDVAMDRIDTADHVFGNMDRGGLYTTTDQSGQVTGGRFAAGKESGISSGYAFRKNPMWDETDEVTQSAVYTYSPTDPEARMLPVDRPVTIDDLSHQTESWLDDFYESADWTMDDVSERFAGLTPTSEAMMERAADDPVQAALIHDAMMFLDEAGVGFDEMRLVDTATFEELHNSVSGAVKEFGGRTDEGASIVNDYRDHLYDDLGIKGLTRQGGLRSGHDVPHEHNIWFRPSEDLELVGTADYSAALAETGMKQIESQQASMTGMANRLRRQAEAGDAELAAKHAAVDATQAKRAKYGTDAGALKQSKRTQQADQAVQSAVDQLDMTRTFEKDTLDNIDERIRLADRDLTDVRQWLTSGAPLADSQRGHLEDMMDALRDGVKWGHIHKQALKTGDTQMQRLAAMERAAAQTRASITDLRQGADLMNQRLSHLPTETYEHISKSMKSGMYQEIRHGIGTPNEVSEWLHHVERLADPEHARGVMQTYDRVVGWIKDWQIATPGFLSRNMMGGMFNNSLEGVQLSSYRDVIRGMRAARNPEAYAAFAKRNPKIAKVYDQVRDFVGAGQAGSEFSEGVAGKGALNPFNRNFGYLKGMKTANEAVEHVLRGALAYDVIKRGGTIDDAVSLVTKYHFDYSDLSRFEQGIRKVVPFYTWTRKNIPLQIEQMVKNPKNYNRYANAMKTLELESEKDPIVPEWFSEQGLVRTPFTSGGGHNYLGIDLPFKDIQEFASGGVGELPSDIASMTTPVLKTPVEAVMGKQFFKGIELSSDKRVPVPLPGILVKGVGPALKSLGIAEESADGLVMTEKDAYVLEQFAPMVARFRRLAPKEDKFEQKRMQNILSTVFGIGMRTNTREEQEINRSYDRKGDEQKLYNQLQLDLVGVSERDVDKLWQDFFKARNKIRSASKKELEAAGLGRK